MKKARKTSDSLGTRLWKCAYEWKEFFFQLLRVDMFRFVVAWTRYVYFVHILRRLREFSSDSENIGINTIHHNKLRLGSFKKLIVKRSNLLLYPLAALRLSRKTPILCIGPRTEGEILNYMGMGFRNIRGFDLISYSPWIDLGDMHALPYKDDQFGVSLLSFCFTYSNNKKQVADEMIRVTKNGGIIGIGEQYMTETPREISDKVGYQMPGEEKLPTIASVLAYFGDHVGHILFHEDRPDFPCDKYDHVVLFSLKK